MDLNSKIVEIARDLGKLKYIFIYCSFLIPCSIWLFFKFNSSNNLGVEFGYFIVYLLGAFLWIIIVVYGNYRMLISMCPFIEKLTKKHKHEPQILKKRRLPPKVDTLF